MAGLLLWPASIPSTMLCIASAPQRSAIHHMSALQMQQALGTLPTLIEGLPAHCQELGVRPHNQLSASTSESPASSDAVTSIDDKRQLPGANVALHAQLRAVDCHLGDLACQLLAYDPSRRLTAAEALSHACFHWKISQDWALAGASPTPSQQTTSGKVDAMGSAIAATSGTAREGQDWSLEHKGQVIHNGFGQGKRAACKGSAELLPCALRHLLVGNVSSSCSPSPAAVQQAATGDDKLLPSASSCVAGTMPSTPLQPTGHGAMQEDNEIDGRPGSSKPQTRGQTGFCQAQGASHQVQARDKLAGTAPTLTCPPNNVQQVDVIERQMHDIGAMASLQAVPVLCAISAAGQPLQPGPCHGAPEFSSFQAPLVSPSKAKSPYITASEPMHALPDMATHQETPLIQAWKAPVILSSGDATPAASAHLAEAMNLVSSAGPDTAMTRVHEIIRQLSPEVRCWHVATAAITHMCSQVLLRWRPKPSCSPCKQANACGSTCCMHFLRPCHTMQSTWEKGQQDIRTETMHMAPDLAETAARGRVALQPGSPPCPASPPQQPSPPAFPSPALPSLVSPLPSGGSESDVDVVGRHHGLGDDNDARCPRVGAPQDVAGRSSHQHLASDNSMAHHVGDDASCQSLSGLGPDDAAGEPLELDPSWQNSSPCKTHSSYMMP